LSARRSCLRELMSSLVNTLRRCYSTVRGLMNSSAPISGFVCPARRAARSAPPGGADVTRLIDPLASGFSGDHELATRALGKGVGPDAAERLVGGPKLLAGVKAPILATQPLAVEEPGASEVSHATAALEPLDRLAAERLRSSSIAQQGARAGLDPERPIGAARLRARPARGLCVVAQTHGNATSSHNVRRCASID
jgi:hypothetical protein